MTDEEVRWKSTANDAFQTVLAGFTLRLLEGYVTQWAGADRRMIRLPVRRA